MSRIKYFQEEVSIPGNFNLLNLDAYLASSEEGDDCMRVLRNTGFDPTVSITSDESIQGCV